MIGFLAIALLAIGSLAGMVWALIRGNAVRRSAQLAEEVLTSASGGYLIIDRQAPDHCCPRLLEWLDIATPVTEWRQLAATDGAHGIDPSDFAEFADALTKLTAINHPFAITLHAANGQKTLRAEGRANDGPASPRHIIWFSDITDQAAREKHRDERISEVTRANDYLTAILGAAPFPIWRRRRDLKIEWVNKAYVEAVDGQSAEAVIDAQTELVSNALARSPNMAAGEALASKTARTEQHFVVIKGQRRAIATTDVPLASGKAVAGFAIDNTDLECARAELSRHIEAHSETLNKMSSAIAIFGRDSFLEFFNSTFAQLWRLPEDWLATKPHHSEILESMQAKRRLPEQADFPAWKREQLMLYTELIAPREELWHLPDESTLRVVTQPHPFGGLLVLYEDVTDRLKLEAQYNTLTAVQRESLNNLFEGVAVFGSDGLLKLYNPAFAKIWRLDDSFLQKTPHIKEVVERCRKQFDHDEEWRKVTGAILDHATERTSNVGRMHRPDGTVIDYASLPLPDGATLYTYLDVSDGFRIEQALRERNEALETSDRLKSEFIAHVSYELRTPLNTILGFTEILDKEFYGPLNERQHEYVDGTLDSSKQLLTLINDILDLATIEAGAMTLEPTEFDFYEALKSVLSIAQEQAEKKRISIHFDCFPRIGRIEADERRLKQVLFNLLSNAIKFTPSEGGISLGARSTGDHFEFYVSDTGIGMNSTEQIAAFEKFWTGSVGRPTQGAGLGLSLVRSFVELHGGRVELSSQSGKGTMVRCILPKRLTLTKKGEPAGETDDGGQALPTTAIN